MHIILAATKKKLIIDFYIITNFDYDSLLFCIHNTKHKEPL